jgi:hypothetical protein
MTPAQVDTWLALLDASCAQAETSSLDIIVDQAGLSVPLLPSVLSVQPSLPWYSLFTGLPEEGVGDVGPLLVRVDLSLMLQRQWLIGLLHTLALDSQPLVLASQWPFQTLARHLGQCLEAVNGGSVGLLRYYDPCIFPVLFSHVLQADQQQPWLRPALFWSWLDRDAKPRWLLGTSEIPLSPDKAMPIELSDVQLDVLGCVSDATRLMKHRGSELPPGWSAEHTFQACYAAMLQASQDGLTLDADREAFTLDQCATHERASSDNTGTKPYV